MSTPDRVVRDDQLLAQRRLAVQQARVNLRRCRAAPTGWHEGRSYAWFCTDLASAMVAYADAAAECGVPVPYRYRDEMRLYRAIGKV